MQLETLFSRHTPVRLSARVVVCFALMSAIASGAPETKAKSPSAAAMLQSLPMRFEQDANGRWTARGAGYALAFEGSAVRVQGAEGAVRVVFDGANSASSNEVIWEPSEKALAPTNYFRGHAFRSADAFGRLRRRNLYPGIDIVFYGTGQKLEYDFDLAPGADASRIRMRFQGADAVRLDDSGAVAMKVGSAELVQQLPSVYQTRASGEIVAVPSAYQMAADGSVGLKLGTYDHSQALVIDPAILYDFWFTGSNAQAAIALGHDGQGFEYMAGYTYSPDFSAGGNGIYPNYHSDEDCWLIKFNPFATAGSSVIVYSTYFGGELDDDMRAMVVDQNGVMYFGGTSLSPDLPVTSNAYQSTLPNSSALLNGFVAAIDTNIQGTSALLYSSFFGGSMQTIINGIATSQGQIYITGRTVTNDLPTVNPFQVGDNGNDDAFIAAFNPSITTASSTLVYSSYLGGSQQDVGRSIDVDSNGLIYVTGYTYSPDFPIVGNAFQPFYNDGGGDAFVTIVDPVAGQITYSTFLGGTNIDVATKIQVDPSGNVAVAGYTFSTDFPVSVQAAQPYHGGSAAVPNADAFIAVLNPAATNQAAALVYGTFYGGSNAEIAYDMRRDSQGLFYIGGYTLSSDLPVSPNALFPKSAGGGIDAFTAIIDPKSALLYGSYITSDGNQVVYAVDDDKAGNIYAAGYATGPIFPSNTPPHSTPGEYDVFFLLVSPH